MSESKIGVFDSGLGGLTAVRELMEILPGENIVYFGDTARVPYGTRSKETICQFAAQDLRFLLEQDLKAVLVACGTVSSVALPLLQGMTQIPVIGVVNPTAAAACKATKNRKIGILGTSATVKSGSYQSAIAAIDPDISVVAQACPLFVPLVENGYLDGEITELAAKEYMKPLQDAGVDTVILGCTHYPLLKPVLSRLFGEGVTLIDSGREAALELANVLRQSNQLSAQSEGDRRYYVSDEISNFSHIAGMFLHRDIDGLVEKVTIRTDD
ncbi:MAG: glutamate racemase [Clostridia bacterium]|nr:glutamate racemase [Clostridia bacterium]